MENKLAYIEEAYNIVALVLSKNAEFVPKSWQPDLQNFVHHQDKFFEKLSKEENIVSVHGKNNEILLVNDGFFKYMRIENNPEYVTYLMEKNNIKTTEELEETPIRWNTLWNALCILNDFMQFGYDINMKECYSNSHKNTIFAARTNKKDALSFIKEITKFPKDIKVLNCLSVNQELFKEKKIHLDTDYDLLMDCELKEFLETSFKKEYYTEGEITFHDKADTIKNIATAGQYYMDTIKGRFYLPIIQTADNQIISFAECKRLLEEVKLSVRTNCRRDDLHLELGQIVEPNILELIDRYGYHSGAAYKQINCKDKDIDELERE